VKVDIWSDVVCPWCYIGKRRFEAALARFPHRDAVEVVWRSFELDPHAPRHYTEGAADHLAAKYGISRDEALARHADVARLAAEEGVSFRFELAQSGNTFDAHRLLHLAADRGLGGPAKERLLAAYFSEGEPIGDPETLVRLVAEVGVAADDARAVLLSDAYAEAVRADEREAAMLGISGVPFFVVDGRYGISGGQSAELIAHALEQAWAEAHPSAALTPVGAGATCSDDSCAV